MSNFFLPTQRCFQELRNAAYHGSLFSAYAEVFLRGKTLKGLSGTFLCLRRGVSIGAYFPRGNPRFSLPTQRCFRERQGSGPFYLLFSAYAEVFLVAFKLKLFFYSFLCLRRGVSELPEDSC